MSGNCRGKICNSIKSKCDHLYSTRTSGIIIFAIHFWKIHLQKNNQDFSSTLPLTLATPLILTATVTSVLLRETDVCSFNSYIPSYLCLKASTLFGNDACGLLNVVKNDHLWIWLQSGSHRCR